MLTDDSLLPDDDRAVFSSLETSDIELSIKLCGLVFDHPTCPMRFTKVGELPNPKSANLPWYGGK
jgi:hypothetical protein